MTSNRNLESNQIEIGNTFSSSWQTNTLLQAQISYLVEKFRLYLPVYPQSSINENVQAILVAQNTLLITVKIVLETVYPDFSSEEWLELEEDFNESMRRGDRSAAIVQTFRHFTEMVFELIEPDISKYNREINQLWEMVKLCYRKQTAYGL